MFLTASIIKPSELPRAEIGTENRAALCCASMPGIDGGTPAVNLVWIVDRTEQPYREDVLLDFGRHCHLHRHRCHGSAFAEVPVVGRELEGLTRTDGVVSTEVKCQRRAGFVRFV